ncbi:hypothetical protein [Staphylococcus edaphicus]|nr:hypothetical protein [Staphylococcus edaphicus]
MDVIGKVVSFIMTMFSNLNGSKSLVEDVKNGIKQNLNKDK